MLPPFLTSCLFSLPRNRGPPEPSCSFRSRLMCQKVLGILLIFGTKACLRVCACICVCAWLVWCVHVRSVLWMECVCMTVWCVHVCGMLCGMCVCTYMCIGYPFAGTGQVWVRRLSLLVWPFLNSHLSDFKHNRRLAPGGDVRLHSLQAQWAGRSSSWLSALSCCCGDFWRKTWCCLFSPWTKPRKKAEGKQPQFVTLFSYHCSF